MMMRSQFNCLILTVLFCNVYGTSRLNPVFSAEDADHMDAQEARYNAEDIMSYFEAFDTIPDDVFDESSLDSDLDHEMSYNPNSDYKFPFDQDFEPKPYSNLNYDEQSTSDLNYDKQSSSDSDYGKQSSSDSDYGKQSSSSHDPDDESFTPNFDHKLKVNPVTESLKSDQIKKAIRQAIEQFAEQDERQADSSNHRMNIRKHPSFNRERFRPNKIHGNKRLEQPLDPKSSDNPRGSESRIKENYLHEASDEANNPEKIYRYDDTVVTAVDDEKTDEHLHNNEDYVYQEDLDSKPQFEHHSSPNPIHNINSNPLHNIGPNPLHNIGPYTGHNINPDLEHNTNPDPLHNINPNPNYNPIAYQMLNHHHSSRSSPGSSLDIQPDTMHEEKSNHHPIDVIKSVNPIQFLSYLLTSYENREGEFSPAAKRIQFQDHDHDKHATTYNQGIRNYDSNNQKPVNDGLYQEIINKLVNYGQQNNDQLNQRGKLPDKTDTQAIKPSQKPIYYMELQLTVPEGTTGLNHGHQVQSQINDENAYTVPPNHGRKDFSNSELQHLYNEEQQKGYKPQQVNSIQDQIKTSYKVSNAQEDGKERENGSEEFQRMGQHVINAYRSRSSRTRVPAPDKDEKSGPHVSESLASTDSDPTNSSTIHTSLPHQLVKPVESEASLHDHLDNNQGSKSHVENTNQRSDLDLINTIKSLNSQLNLLSMIASRFPVLPLNRLVKETQPRPRNEILMVAPKPIIFYPNFYNANRGQANQDRGQTTKS